MYKDRNMHICRYICIYPSRQLQAGCDPASNSKQNTACVISTFSFS